MGISREAVDRVLAGRDTNPVHEPARSLSWDTWDIN
jgi:hypothetical protein